MHFLAHRSSFRPGKLGVRQIADLHLRNVPLRARRLGQSGPTRIPRLPRTCLLSRIRSALLGHNGRQVRPSHNHHSMAVWHPSKRNLCREENRWQRYSICPWHHSIRFPTSNNCYLDARRGRRKPTRLRLGGGRSNRRAMFQHLIPFSSAIRKRLSCRYSSHRQLGNSLFALCHGWDLASSCLPC